MNKRYNLLKPNEEALDNKGNTFRVKLIESTKKDEKQHDIELMYLTDFFNDFKFIKGELKDDEPLMILFTSVEGLLKTRLEIYYEHLNIKSNPIPYKKIKKENKDFLNSIEGLLRDRESKSHITMTDRIHNEELKLTLEESKSNALEGIMYKSPYIDYLESAIQQNNKIFFDILKRNGVSLGTKNFSSKILSTNYDYATYNYGVFCNPTLRQEFINVMSGTKDINECSKPIKSIVSKSANEDLNMLLSHLVNSNCPIEFTLLLFIMNNLMMSFSPQDIESFYEEEELYGVKYAADESVEKNTNELYLSKRFK